MVTSDDGLDRIESDEGDKMPFKGVGRSSGEGRPACVSRCHELVSDDSGRASARPMLEAQSDPTTGMKRSQGKAGATTTDDSVSATPELTSVTAGEAYWLSSKAGLGWCRVFGEGTGSGVRSTLQLEIEE